MLYFIGVRVIPEFDQPSHVGNGWNFPGGEEMTVCVNQEPWYNFCVEPPCGQLDPTEPKVLNCIVQLASYSITIYIIVDL